MEKAIDKESVRERNLIKSFLKYIQWPLPVAFYYVKTHKRCTRGRHDPSQIAIAQNEKKKKIIIEKKMKEKKAWGWQWGPKCLNLMSPLLILSISIFPIQMEGSELRDTMTPDDGV